MSSALAIIHRPLVTERATNLKATGNQYVFRVASGATKNDIKAAIEQLFKVHVLSVNTMRVHGAYRPDWKKAIVSLKPGQEIRVGEEVK